MPAANTIELPASLTPTVVDERQYQPKLRVDFESRQVNSILTDIVFSFAGTILDAAAPTHTAGFFKHATANEALSQYAASDFSDIATSISIHEVTAWSHKNLGGSFGDDEDDYDVAEIEGINLAASRSYGW